MMSWDLPIIGMCVLFQLVYYSSLSSAMKFGDCVAASESRGCQEMWHIVFALLNRSLDVYWDSGNRWLPLSANILTSVAHITASKEQTLQCHHKWLWRSEQYPDSWQSTASTNDPCSSQRCGCQTGHLPCTFLCACCGELSCCNPYNKDMEREADDEDERLC